MTDEDIEKRLLQLGHATEGLNPRADFSARVMRAVALEGAARAGMNRAGWLDDVLAPARRLVPIAALAAAIALAWAVRSEAAFDDAVASSDDTVELEW